MKNTHIILLISILLFACSQASTENQKKPLSAKEQLNEFKKIGKLHVKLGEPQPGEWLYHHEEKGQAFGNYVNKKNKVCPNNELNKIAILPIGNFNELETTLLKQTASYVSTFFMLDVELLGSVSDRVVPGSSRRLTYFDEQLHTKYILDSILVPNIPDSAICFITITNKDLYPKEDWNFVFGQAYLTKRTGVSSYRRYYENQLDTNNFNLTFERTIKTTTHELCHMFSIKHCRIYKCLLNGSNHLPEADSKPLWLCPECLAKLQYCLQFSLNERYDKLIEFFTKKQMQKEIAYYKKSKQLMSVENN